MSHLTGEANLRPQPRRTCPQLLTSIAKDFSVGELRGLDKPKESRSHTRCPTDHLQRTASYASLGNFANMSLGRSIGAAIKPATVSNGGLSGASGWLLSKSQPVLREYSLRMMWSLPLYLAGTNIFVLLKLLARLSDFAGR